MEPTQDFKSLQEGVQKSLISTVKTVNRIAAEDLGFQRTVNPEVAQQLEDRTSRILELSTRLLQSAAKACGVKSAPKLEDAEDIDMNWRGVVDVVDTVLEKADTALDEYTGLVKRKEPPTAESASKTKKAKSTNKVIRNANISKPQVQFEVQPDNFPKGPWKPILTAKPHAKVPLDESLVTVKNENGALQYEDLPSQRRANTPSRVSRRIANQMPYNRFRHPYEAEINTMTYPQRVYQNDEPIMYQPVDTTQATYVDTYEGVLGMLEELKGAKEIAVDLEHHDFRTYVGLVCLMQISTREKDWIVDTLQPWRHKLEVLNEVFTDPSIVKVFHGAYMDMVWLQRDLGLYVNGLFDTFFACDLLYSGRSLAFLLGKFANFDADKQYQLADWRMRPLQDEMLYYARSDTHYLLYIYDRCRNDLIASSNAETNYLDGALQKSRELSLSRHEHPGYNEETGEGSRGWYGYIFKHSHLGFNSEQFSVFKAVWKWRDDTAREKDESPNFVLSTTSIAEIARINPPDAKALHSLLPGNAPLARPRAAEIWDRIKKAKAKGGPSMLHFFTSMAPDLIRKKGLPIAARESTRLPDLDGEITVTRLTRSQLFGDMPISTRWEESKPASHHPDDIIPFPWQRFVEQNPVEADLQHDGAAEGITANEGQSLEVEAAAGNAELEEEVDQEFTLKRGQKRKSGASEEEEPASNDDQQDLDSDEEMQDDEGVISMREEQPKKKPKKALKKERKAREKDEKRAAQEKKEEAKKVRRARKLEKRQKRNEEQQENAKKYDAVPFDYSKASSVLHANRGANGAAQEGRKKTFDPYSKIGDDALKGGRKAPPIRGERSATFKK
ncbi:Fc.00g016230.m01.CDS01 [Cosmosporella sp. VM-42]